MADKLTDLQRMFALEYIVDLKPGPAAIRAGYSQKTASQKASKLLTLPHVQDAIAEAMKERSTRTEITVDRVLLEYARLGFLDPRKFFNTDGKPKDITELDDDTAAALAGFEVMEQYEGEGKNREFVGYIKKYKLINKKDALDSIAKHLGMFNDRSRDSDNPAAGINVGVTVVNNITNVEVNHVSNQLDRLPAREDRKQLLDLLGKIDMGAERIPAL